MEDTKKNISLACLVSMVNEPLQDVAPNTCRWTNEPCPSISYITSTKQQSDVKSEPPHAVNNSLFMFLTTSSPGWRSTCNYLRMNNWQWLEVQASFRQWNNILTLAFLNPFFKMALQKALQGGLVRSNKTQILEENLKLKKKKLLEMLLNLPRQLKSLTAFILKP